MGQAQPGAGMDRSMQRNRGDKRKRLHHIKNRLFYATAGKQKSLFLNHERHEDHERNPPQRRVFSRAMSRTLGDASRTSHRSILFTFVSFVLFVVKISNLLFKGLFAAHSSLGFSAPAITASKISSDMPANASRKACRARASLDRTAVMVVPKLSDKSSTEVPSRYRPASSCS